jgi:galactokinase
MENAAPIVAAGGHPAIGEIVREFIDRFAATPRCYRAPGRVNLIGEHTDYNGGLVMPVAIQFDTTVAVAPRADRRLRVRSTHFEETREIELSRGGIDRRRESPVQWIDYVAGVAHMLQELSGPLPGADLLIHGAVPLGAGLSSSAALEVSVALALCSLAGQRPEKLALAKLCQRAENEYVGMRCGIMDPFASIYGRSGHALKIDCRSLECDFVPLNPLSPCAPVQIVVCNTMVRHQHAGGEYNRRREECELGVRSLGKMVRGVESLRDVSPEMLRSHERALDPLVYRRCRHVVTENERVRAGAAALEAGDFEAFGSLMRDSHRSLQEDFEVSCAELDLMVRVALSIEGVYGARMTGGGFGGCTVNLVRADAVPRFTAEVAGRYCEGAGHRPQIYVCAAADGAGAVEI